MSRKQFHHFIRLSLLLVFLVVPLTGYAQGIDQRDPLDFEKIFAEGLKRRGKFLDLSGKKIGDEGLKVLSRQKWLQKLTKIDLRYNDITEEGAKTLTRFPPLPKLKVLILRHNFLADNGAVILSQAKNFPNLVEIQLGWNEVRDAGAVAFADTKNFSKLRKLDLRGNFLSGATKSELKKTLAHLKSLKLY
jgi:Ran GTPase-activating protein (RanGAP) involved in mRNA processing and transport